MFRLALAALLAFAAPVSAQQAGWKAGFAAEKITPLEPMWMSGYASRTAPADGTETDLWAKAAILQAPDGTRFCLVTLDLVGVSRDTSLAVVKAISDKHRLPREAVALAVSHTHCGPVVGKNLRSMYFLDDRNAQLVDAYTDALPGKVLKAVDAAVAAVGPVTLSAAVGSAGFAVNRRENKEADVPALREKGALKGPNDHAVPVLAARDPQGKLKGIVFGYACHATVLGFQKWCGDYPGFAQIELEKAHPGAVALFWAGCGADQNPLPRRQVELCRRYGKMLADGVNAALKKPLDPLPPALRTAYGSVGLKYERVIDRRALQKAAKEGGLRGRWAGRLLQRIDAGEKLATADTYDYPVVVWHLGGRQLWIALAGEVVVDYALGFKAEYGQRTWVAAYTNDLVAYIPSRRVWAEGGYEGAGVYEYGLPAERWAGDVEERIAARVRELVRQVGGPAPRNGPGR